MKTGTRAYFICTLIVPYSNSSLDKQNTTGIHNQTLYRCKMELNIHGNHLAPTHRETHVCVVCTVATDALVLKHQAISIHNAD